MAFLRVEDHMIRYELAGEENSVTLVFVNGLTQAAHLWGAYVPRFVEKGYRVLTFDMLGQGESDKPVLSFDFDYQARTMSALIERLGIERPFIAGISFGGAVALRYAILYPDKLRGLVAMGAFSELDGRLKWIGENLYMGLASVGMEYIQNWFMPFNFSSKWLEENAAAIPVMRRRGYSLNDQYALQNLMESVAKCSSFSHELPDIRVPALILNGEYDYITHRGLQNILRAGIARSRLVIIQHASHAFTLEYPELTIRLIDDFMEKVEKDEWPGDQTTWVANDDPDGEPLYLPVLGDPLRAIQPGPVSAGSPEKTVKEQRPPGVESKEPGSSAPTTNGRLGRIILEPETQTRISSFLVSIKQVNALILFQVKFQQADWRAYALLHSQFSREVQLIGLLQRVTDWSTNPSVYIDASITNLRHLGDLQFVRFQPVNFLMDPLLFYRYLALTHALYAQLRFIPLLPVELPLEHQYLSFLHTLEAIHGQQMQAQITMLRQLTVSLSEREREVVVGEESQRVREVFRKFMEELL